MQISKFIQAKPSHKSISMRDKFVKCELHKDSDDDDKFYPDDNKIYHISWAVFTHWNG